MEKAAQKDREREQRRAQYGSQQPMQPYEPRPSYGGHTDFGQDEEEPLKPRIRLQWRLPEEEEGF